MLTRRKAQAQEWQAQLAGAAELPEQVQLHILRELIGGSSFAQLNALQRVSKTWHSTIRCDATFLKQLRAAKLCALEQQAWGKAGIGSPSNKKLPESFELPFLSSSGTVSSIPFRIYKKYKRASLFVVEAHSSASPSQVLSLLQTMCELEGAVCAMLFLLQFPAESPAEWVQQIKEGAAAITSPTTVNVVTRFDFDPKGTVIMHPKNEQYKFWVKPRVMQT